MAICWDEGTPSHHFWQQTWSQHQIDPSSSQKYNTNVPKENQGKDSNSLLNAKVSTKMYVSGLVQDDQTMNYQQTWTCALFWGTPCQKSIRTWRRQHRAILCSCGGDLSASPQLRAIFKAQDARFPDQISPTTGDFLCDQNRHRQYALTQLLLMDNFSEIIMLCKSCGFHACWLERNILYHDFCGCKNPSQPRSSKQRIRQKKIVWSDNFYPKKIVW